MVVKKNQGTRCKEKCFFSILLEKKFFRILSFLYRAQEGFVNLDSARQSTIEACGPNDEAIVKTMAAETREGPVAAETREGPGGPSQ